MGILKTLINLVFPEKNICFICDEYDNTIENNLCPICISKLEFIKESKCKICGRKIDTNIDKLIKCRNCLKTPHYFTKTVAPLVYNKAIKKVIYDFKYNNKPYMYKLFGELMVKSIIDNDLEHIDIIVSVPLHKYRQRKRGFNQSHLLGKYISKKLEIPIDKENLIRITKTQEQNKIKRSERIRNVEGVFAIIKKDIFIQKRVLLIDDIYTTGSTVDECSKLLLDNGAKEVFVATIAIVP